MRKSFCLIFISLIITIKPINAQDTPIPPVLTPQPNSNAASNNTIITNPVEMGSGTANPISEKTDTPNVNNTNQKYETSIQERINIDQSEIQKLLAQAYQPEPYQINCAPQTLNSSAKINFSAYTIAILPSNLIENASLEVIAVALNATFPQRLNSTRKTVLGSIVGKGLSSALTTLPSFLTVAFAQSPTSFAPSFVALASTSIPAINTGSSDYGNNRISIHEIKHYDGIFRDYAAYLGRISTMNQKHAKYPPEKYGMYNKLPLYADLIVNKESNNGKPIIQITNSLGQSWSYFLNCDSRSEISQEHQQAATLLDKLKSIINLPNP